MQSHESDQSLENGISSGKIAPNSELVHTSLNKNDGVPIALRKGKRTCTKHPIEIFVSYSKKNIQEVLQQPEWEANVIEEVKTLIKNNTWEIIALPEGKKQVVCKWIF